MSLVACGINHKTAPLALRERMVFLPEQIVIPLLELVNQERIREAAILSTCNRTEIYCEADSNEHVIDWLHQQHRLTAPILQPCLYWHQDQAAVQHIMRVASGLDSMVLGEPQILGQMKSAVSLAQQAGTLGSYLQRLFQYVFSVIKRVRSTTAIGKSPVSVIYAAVTLAKRIFTDLTTTSVLLIGAGEVIELAAKHLRQQGVQRILIANRTLSKAVVLADRYGGTAIAISDLPAYLAEADIIISATASALPILGKGAMERSIKQRKHRPMFIVDLAVPRDVEPEVAKLADIYLYTIDDLQSVIRENLHERQQAAEQAEAMIEIHAGQFMRYLHSLDAAITIRAYRARVAEIREAELAKAIRMLQSDVDPKEVLAKLAHSLTNKIMHAPSVQLRQAAYQGQYQALEWAQKLLGLKEDI